MASRYESLPARGVWVEILLPKVALQLGMVTPRTGSVG